MCTTYYVRIICSLCASIGENKGPRPITENRPVLRKLGMSFIKRFFLDIDFLAEQSITWKKRLNITAVLMMVIRDEWTEQVHSIEGELIFRTIYFTVIHANKSIFVRGSCSQCSERKKAASRSCPMQVSHSNTKCVRRDRRTLPISGGLKFTLCARWHHCIKFHPTTHFFTWVAGAGNYKLIAKCPFGFAFSP